MRRSARSQLVDTRLQGVLGLFLGIAIGALHLATGLLGLALGFERLVAGHAASHFLGLALDLIHTTFDLILVHGELLSWLQRLDRAVWLQTRRACSNPHRCIGPRRCRTAAGYAV